MADVTNVLIVGVGGQGTLLASKIIGQVAMLEGLAVKQSEVHGMAQRGGSVVTHVRFGDKVYSPLVEKGEADIILAFENLEALRWAEYLRPGGTLIINDQEIPPMPVIIGAAVYPQQIFDRLTAAGINVVRVNALELAQSIGETRTVNVILLAVAAKRMGYPKKLWEEAMQEAVPSKALAVNLQALSIGWDLG
ncbi:MAG: indolepyruvate oxidoreductase subunit beta [Negativicutes bacterium]|nr:indolepyruvate oxidoreductase subunit beta [Negativicutes bacterium]